MAGSLAEVLVTCPRSGRTVRVRPRRRACCEGKASLLCPDCGSSVYLVTAGPHVETDRSRYRVVPSNHPITPLPTPAECYR
jgi:hypothetical protein